MLRGLARRSCVVVVAFCLLFTTPVLAQAPIAYRLSFPEPEHRWMQVEVTFPDLDEKMLEIRMSRTSPGRYALHEFAKNVFDVRAFDGAGRPLPVTKPDPHQWNVSGHDGTVRVLYKIYGDRVDGTYMAVDTSHAHLNMPAALMWARGLHGKPATVRFARPPDRDWNVATQLFPTDDPLTFTAPNFQYLMDSPAEFSAFSLRTFTVPPVDGVGPGAQFRVAMHHEGSDAELDRYTTDLARIVREAGAVFGEYPEFETGAYTFIADYLPYASDDGMEHRNSTILTSPSTLRDEAQRIGLLGTAAHEVFHAWSVERIRPASLEPFNFEEANMSDELWLAEGFTSYYTVLLLQRAGIARLERTLGTLGAYVNVVAGSPAREFRSVVDMSRLAPFVDAARSVDRTNWENTFISYYTWGAAIGLGLDLALRQRSGGEVTLDDYMRALWVRFGRPGGHAPGYVDRPYTMSDTREVLAEVAGDRSFADEFFDRYIEGGELIDYAPLLRSAGLLLRRTAPGRAWLGMPSFEFSASGMRVTAPTLFGSPLHMAGVAQDDVVVTLDGDRIGSPAALDQWLRRRAPNQQVPVVYVRRDGERVSGTLTLQEDPGLTIVAAEAAGETLTTAQRAFREAWLTSRVGAAVLEPAAAGR